MPPSAPAGLQALIRRRVRVVEEDALYRIMVPQPLPLSWGRTVQPYNPAISLLRRVRALHHPHEPMCRPHKVATGIVWSPGMERLHGCITGQRAEHALVFCLLVQDFPTEMLDE